MKKIIYIFLFLIPMICYAQEIVFQQEQYPISVTFYGIESQLGFIDANSGYHPFFCNADDDLDFDLFIGCNMGRVYYIKNIGTSNIADYMLVTTQLVPPVIHFGDFMNIVPSLVDIDDDADYDLFLAEAEGFVWYYENVGTPDSFSFELVDTSYFNIDVPDGPVLDFVDIDNDHDFDMFIGVSWSQQNGRLYFYLNDGTPDSAVMVYETDFFDSIDVGEKSSPEFCDIDADEDYDLFVGCEDGTIWFYENIGTPDSCDFEYVTDSYFDIYTGEVSVPRFCDIDNDGDFDLFVANESAGNTNEFEGDIAYYENTGDEYNADFTFVTGNYLFMDMSTSSRPCAVDIDGDSLIELLVGINGGELVLLENDGTQSEPSFYFADSAFLNLDITYNPTLSFADLDDDTDLDMVVRRGSWNDQWIDLYLNVGTSTQPDFEYETNLAFCQDHSGGGIDLCDIDGDSDFDLFFGDGLNEIEFWENIGDTLNPRFQLVSENYLNQIPGFGEMYPRFNDLDHDGDFDLIMGYNYGTGFEGHLVFWLNIGTPSSADFIVEDTLFTFPAGTVVGPKPTLTDIDGDGDDDMFVGEGGGAMLFLRNMEYNSVNRERRTENRSFTLLSNYPNPFNAQTKISFNLPADIDVSLRIFDLQGREVSVIANCRMSAGEHSFNWNAGNMSSGIYFAVLNSARTTSIKKMVLMK